MNLFQTPTLLAAVLMAAGLGIDTANASMLYAAQFDAGESTIYVFDTGSKTLSGTISLGSEASSVAVMNGLLYTGSTPNPNNTATITERLMDGTPTGNAFLYGRRNIDMTADPVNAPDGLWLTDNSNGGPTDVPKHEPDGTYVGYVDGSIGDFTGAAYDASRNWLWVCYANDGLIEAIDLGTGLIEATFPFVDLAPTTLAYDPDDDTLWVADWQVGAETLFHVGTDGTMLGDDITTGISGNFLSIDIPVPEPATLSLLGLGGLAMIRRRRAC